MADEYILKHLQEVLNAINELEGFFTDFPKRFDLFEKDGLRICAVERKTEIMGEAINRIRKKVSKIIRNFAYYSALALTKTTHVRNISYTTYYGTSL